MRQLYIDGKPAVIKSGTSFKFHRENTYFTDAEDYTLDVELPLKGCSENIEIFSALHRPEASLVHLIGKKYPFRFVAPPLDIEGSAIVTEVNEAEVKIQLLAGSSVLNFDKTDALGHDIYIDELDLGCAYDVSLKDIYTEANKSIYPSYYLWKELVIALNNGTNGVDMYATFDNSKDGCVTFTVYSETTEHTANKKFYLERVITSDAGVEYEEKLYLKSHNNLSGPPYDSVYIAAQPYLLLILERVLKCIGYNLNPNNDIAKSWQKDIFIANVRNEYQYSKILPHWTVSEFLKEISLFCGVMFVTEGNTVNAVRKSDYYGDESRAVHIKEIIDEYSTVISEEEEGSDDPRTGNVGYDFENIDPMLQLPDEVWEKATIIEPFSSDTVLAQWISMNIPETDRSKSNWLFTGGKKTFAFIQDYNGSFGLAEVDMCGNLIRNGRRDVDITLRIVPATMRKYTIDYKYYLSGMKKDRIAIAMLSTQAARDKLIDSYSVNDAINPNVEQEEEAYSKPERIEVALNSGATKRFGYYDDNGNEAWATIPMAIGIPYYRDDNEVFFTEVWTDSGSHDHKHLLLKEGISSGMYDILTQGKKIDTMCRHTFEFLDDVDMNPKDVFIIRNRKYACEKIEYNIDDNGISPIKRGYFYEIND